MIIDSYGNRRFFGIYRGVVQDNVDPLGKGRVKLRIPQVLFDATTDWAWSKDAHGVHVDPPVIGQGVWVQFEGGDPSFPVWVGTFGDNPNQIEVTLDDLTDAVIASPINKDILQYESSTALWKNSSLGSNSLYVGTTQIVLNRASANQALTGITTINGVTMPSTSSFVLNSDIGSTVQGYDGDLAAIAAISGTSGLLKKTAANTWSLDTSTYLTSVSGTNFSTQDANTVFSGPNTGSAVTPTFRVLVEADIPTLTVSSKVSNSATTATSANTASAIVARDASGNFSAGTITATTFSGELSGNATSATTFAVTNEVATSSAVYPVWVTANTGNLPGKVSSTALSFVPSTGTLTTTTFSGALSGTATRATNLVGGNSTTLLGAIPYQSNTDTTTLLSPNTTSTKKFLRQTGTGTNGAAPAWDTLVASDVPAALSSTTSVNGTTIPSSSTLVTTTTMPAGTVLQAATATLTTTPSTTSSTFAATGLSVTLTPRNSSSKFLLIASANTGNTGTAWNYFDFARGTTLIGTGVSATTQNVGAMTYMPDNSRMETVNLHYLDSPATASAVTYNLYWSTYANTAYLNRRGADAAFKGLSSLTVMEIAG